MSFDEYVHHISQKYRLAVAISVIKTKPNHLSVDEYLLQLQNKIKEMEFDPNETVCSDDFNFDDDGESYEKNPQTRIEKFEGDFSSNETRLDDSVNKNYSHGSQTILNDFVFADGELEVNVRRESSIEDTIRLLKEVSADIQEKPDANQNLSQSTFCESLEVIKNTNNGITYWYGISNDEGEHNNNRQLQNNSKNNNVDSQETQLYTLHGFTQHTHVSQTQGDQFHISDKYVKNKSSNDNNKQDIVKNVNEYDLQVFYNESQNMFTQNQLENVSERGAIGNSINIAQHEVNDVDSSGFANAQSFQFLGQNIVTATDVNDDVNKGDKTTRKVTQINLSNVENRNIDNTQTFQFHIYNSFIREEFTGNNDIADKDTRCKSNKDTSKAILGIHTTEINVNDQNNTDFSNSAPLLSFDCKKTLLHKELPAANNNMENTDVRRIENDLNCKDNQDFDKETTQNNQNYLNNDQSSKEIDVNIENEHEMDVDETESEDSVQERVPFKILEELNRVKTYLNRRDKKNNDGYSTDSGYRSDSQSRSSLKSSSQVCGAWLNQSAFCLFNYIVQMTGTDDINKEIAQVLGQLIDKLHEDENYPPFLEEMLESIDSLLRAIHEGDVGAEDVFITKEENIHRLILLNKSKHILKHSIEKITIILEKLHTNLTQENLYELTNIVEAENICYIFHILDIFLKIYMKIKDASSQSTQNSREEIFPKRSSLTELWRKKWNPNCKEIIKNDNKTCVLKRCREILNKIIVECMDGYSLVAFAALQCFNLIQD